MASETLKILVVDDSVTQLEFLSNWLAEEGYEVFTALNGTQALAKTFEILPDLIISDILMPEMNGYLMCRLLKNEEITSQIPVILLSRLDEEKQVFWGLKCGADAYVVKGKEQEEIPHMIKALCYTPDRCVKGKKQVKKDVEIKPNYHVSNLLDKLLIESTVYLESINLFNLVYDSKQLIDKFFELLSRMVQYSHAGLLIMIPEKPTIYIHSQEKLSNPVAEKIKNMVIKENNLTENTKELEMVPLKEPAGKFSAKTEEIPSSLYFPFHKGLGSINIFSSEPDFYDEPTESAISMLADSFSMVVELMLTYRQTKLQTITDIMTGLYNWNYFELSLDRELSSCKRYKTKCCVCMISIDFYKTLVDTFGRRRGEMVLRQVAEVLKKNFRKADLIAHFGQSEFVGLFTQTDQEGAYTGVDRLRRIVEEHFTQSDQKPFRLTISVGLAEYNEHIAHKDQLIDNAAAALRNAQARGGNRVEKFSNSAHKEKLIANITAALKNARKTDSIEDASWLSSE